MKVGDKLRVRSTGAVIEILAVAPCQYCRLGGTLSGGDMYRPSVFPPCRTHLVPVASSQCSSCFPQHTCNSRRLIPDAYERVCSSTPLREGDVDV